MNEQSVYPDPRQENQSARLTIIYPQPLKFFKKVAALDVKFIKPTNEDPGCWMFQMAKPLPGTGADVRMDWKNSLLMKFGITDATELFYGFKVKKFPIEIFHKNARGSSTLQVSINEKGGFWINMGNNRDGVSSKIGIVLQEKEIDLLLLAMKQMVPSILAWTN